MPRRHLLDFLELGPRFIVTCRVKPTSVRRSAATFPHSYSRFEQKQWWKNMISQWPCIRPLGYIISEGFSSSFLTGRAVSICPCLKALYKGLPVFLNVVLVFNLFNFESYLRINHLMGRSIRYVERLQYKLEDCKCKWGCATLRRRIELN